MDAKSYCDTVSNELTAWKAKIYDVIRRTEKLPTAGQRRVAPMVTELNAALDDLTERIGRLARECPAEFGPERRQIKGKVGEMKTAWKKAWGVLGEKEYGIGGA